MNAILGFVVGTVWPAIWGNLLASAITGGASVAAVAVSHVVRERRAAARHAELMRHVRPAAANTQGT